MKREKNTGSFTFLDWDFNYIINDDESNEEYFHDILDERYLKTNGQLDSDLLGKEINKIKILLYYLNNMKYEYQKQLYEKLNNQDQFLYYHGRSLKKIAIFKKQKTSKIFRFKNKLVNFFTFCYYDFEVKLINKILREKVVIKKQKKELKKIGLKILHINNKLEKIEKEKRKQWKEDEFLKYWYDFTRKMNLQNHSPSTSKYEPNLAIDNYESQKSSIVVQTNSSYQFYLDREILPVDNFDIYSINSDQFLTMQYGENHCSPCCTIF